MSANPNAQAPALLHQLQTCLGAMQAMRDQIEQMRGMFPDDDGLIQAACDEHDDAVRAAAPLVDGMPTVGPDAQVLVAEALTTWQDRFAADEDINGGDLVEWFAEWLQRAQGVAPARVNATVGTHHYRVGWEIDVYADTAEEAARKALAIQRDPASIATVFNVRGGPGPFEQVVDFDPEDGDAPALPEPGGPS